MDYDALKAFVHLTDSLHYGKTSKACNLSPSTLSRTIKRLETQLGKQLFERDNRSVQLTETGKHFRKYARETLARWQAFQDSLTRQSAVLRGEISMYCTITASYGVLPDILVQFRKAYPRVNIKLLTGDSESAIQRVIDGDADFAVAALPDRVAEKLAFTSITTIQLQFVQPAIAWPYSDLLQEQTPPWEQIPLIVAEKGMARKRIDTWFRAKKMRPNIYAQVSGNESILAMVSMGFGIGVVPQLVLEKTMLKRDVRVLGVTPAFKPYCVGICVQKRRITNPLIRAFWEIIQAGTDPKRSGDDT